MKTTMLSGCAILAAAASVSMSTQAQPVQRTGGDVVRLQCAKCHAAGVNGAPRIDDRAAWAPRMRNGLESTVRSAINGHGAMPARGGMASLSDAELRNAILYMFYPAGEAMRKLPAASPAPSDPHHKAVDGMDVYLGIVVARSKDKAPSGAGYYYVNVSLRDAQTGAPVQGAQVDARVANAVSGGETRKLVANSDAGYGEFFRMGGREPYTIALQIRRAGAPAAAETKFEFKP